MLDCNPGNRVSKAVTSGGTITTTHYLRDASGNVMGIYKDTELAEQPIYGSSRLGQYTGRPEPGKRIWQRKMYELSNHLGNVLAVVGDGYTTTSGDKEAWISSLQDYYPFGLAMEGRSSNVAEYRYGFNGMERNGSNVFGGTSYSTHFRQYDSKIGRWMSVDPMMSSFPDQSSYNFVFNQPIISTDVNGDCPNGDFSEEEVVAANEIVTKYFDPSNNQNEISGELYAAGAEYLSNRFGEDASSKEVGLESFNNLLMNTWSDMKTADFLNSELASTYTELINKTETPEEKFDLIELRAIWVHNDVSSLKTIGFSLEALLAAYPGSVAARNKGVGIRGFNYKPRGVFSSINKIHKNSNSYSGHQGVYEIRKDGKLFKYGKADITKLSSTGNPKRLQTQLNALRKLYPKSTISGKVLYSNKKISTTDIKKI